MTKSLKDKIGTDDIYARIKSALKYWFRKPIRLPMKPVNVRDVLFRISKKRRFK